jgi:hypothetical protein
MLRYKGWMNMALGTRTGGQQICSEGNDEERHDEGRQLVGGDEHVRTESG